MRISAPAKSTTARMKRCWPSTRSNSMCSRSAMISLSVQSSDSDMQLISLTTVGEPQFRTPMLMWRSSRSMVTFSTHTSSMKRCLSQVDMNPRKSFTSPSCTVSISKEHRKRELSGESSTHNLRNRLRMKKLTPSLTTLPSWRLICR